jgi:predicted transcriptional regulator
MATDLPEASVSRAARTTTAIRFPPDVHARLQEAAEDRDLSMNFLVVKAVEQFLDALIPAEEIQWTR